MNTFFVTLLVGLSLALLPGCSSKSAKEDVAIPEGDAAFGDMAFEEDVGDGFFDSSFDDSAPAAALGEVLDGGGESWPADEGFEEFAGDDWGDDFGGDFSSDVADSTTTDSAPSDSAGFDDSWDDVAGLDTGTSGSGTSDELFGGSDPFTFEEAPGTSSGATTDDLASLGDDPYFDSGEAAPFSSDELFEAPAPSTSTTSQYDDDVETEVNPPNQMSLVPVQKIKEVPFRRAGQLLNAVYIIRPGDTPESVSDKILGSNRVDDIYAANPHLHRSFKPGDKIYYNSPQRPNDESKILFYYSDAGLAPDVYVSNSGDNIREVSADLLGFEDAWKEVWATNMDVESKWALASGVELRYWKADGGFTTPKLTQNNTPPPVTNNIAQHTPPPPAPSFDEPALPEPSMNSEDDFAFNEPESMPEPEMANFDEFSDDMGSGQNMASNTLPPPPPPPPPSSFDRAGTPPPPPPPRASKDIANVQAEGEMNDAGAMGMLNGMDQDKLMILSAVAVLILGGGMLMVIRRRRNRMELEQAFGDSTQVG